jgi:hypothetical protein
VLREGRTALLPDLEPQTDDAIVADNLRAVQAFYVAWQLEEMRAFEVLERIAQLFQQGLLPLGAGKAGAALHHYHQHAKDRLGAQERRLFYARVLGVPGGEAEDTTVNQEFQALWLRFISAVASFTRQQTVDSLLRNAAVRSAAASLAANASAYGASYFAAKEMAAQIKVLMELLRNAEIRNAFGARDMWQVIDQVSRKELGGAVNLVPHRKLAKAGSTVLQWLAANAKALRNPAAPKPQTVPSETDLIKAVKQWLAASRVQDDAVHNNSQPNC